MATASPNIFDQTVTMGQGSGIRAQMGADAMSGLNQYGALGQEARGLGFAGQQDALEMYRQRAMGLGGPSAGTLQMQQGLGQAQRNQMGAAAMGRGGNLMGMQQAATSGNAGLAAQSAEALRMQQLMEQQAAQQAYAGLGTQMYGQAFGYDQLANQMAQGQMGNALGFYSAKRGLDIAESEGNRDLMMQFAQASASAGGQGSAAASNMF